MQTKNMIAVEVICHHCHTKTTGWKDADGVTKMQCTKCGTVTVSKPMSRRHVQIDVYMPKKAMLVVNN